MTMNIKELGQLERDITQSSSGGSHAVLVLDTGGLIDVATAIREYGLTHKNGNANPHYARTTIFLKSLSEQTKSRIIITPRTYQEIQDHGRMRLNEHTLELAPRIVDFALEIMINSMGFFSRLEHEIELDQTRYDAHWASAYGCRDNPKKHLEGCSDTDKEIIATLASLSTSKFPEVGRRINPVLVLSPDAHIIRGAEFLKRGFDGRYSNIVPISTRYK